MINNTRFVIAKAAMSDTMKLHGINIVDSWSKIKSEIDKGPSDIVLPRHTFDDENFGILVLDAETFKSQVLGPNYRNLMSRETIEGL
jgi:hypothetical protein